MKFPYWVLAFLFCIIDTTGKLKALFETILKLAVSPHKSELGK
jgi:hypothetical protein